MQRVFLVYGEMITYKYNNVNSGRPDYSHGLGLFGEVLFTRNLIDSSSSIARTVYLVGHRHRANAPCGSGYSCASEQACA